MRRGTRWLIPMIALAAACGNDGNKEGDKGDTGSGDTSGAHTDGATGQQGDTVAYDTETLWTNDEALDTGVEDTGTAAVCESVSAATQLEPVYLAIGFDVSGSMGKLDKAWHDPALKWEPVVAATTAFLEDPATTGMYASLTEFPASSDKCETASYTTPQVPMTALPSSAFRDHLETFGTDWRGGTPTLYVLEGLHQYVVAQREQTGGTYAILLVTDGYPEGCGDANDIDLVAQAAQAAAEDGVSVYVIGVNNPPIEGAPDTLDNLHQVAQAGGTEQAFIIATGDPDQTAADFRAAIDAIRGNVLRCDVAIPTPPEGRAFDKAKVAVSAQVDGDEVDLVYDADCAQPNAWHYDDVEAPSELLLCADICERLQSAREAALDVAFTCEDTIILFL